MRSPYRLIVPLAAVALLLPRVAPAQSIWLPGERDSGAALEIFKLFPDSPSGLSWGFFTTAWFATGQLRVSESILIVAEVPFAFADFSVDVPGFTTSDSDAALGNIYAGVEIGKTTSPWFVELGARAPIAPDDNGASAVGAFADLDRWEAFIPELFPINALVNYLNTWAGGFRLRARGGGILWIPTGGGDAELLTLINLQGGYAQPEGKFGANVGLTTRIIVTGSGSFSELTEVQAGANGWFAIGRVRPGVTLLVPVTNDLREINELTVGINAQVSVN